MLWRAFLLGQVTLHGTEAEPRLKRRKETAETMAAGSFLGPGPEERRRGQRVEPGAEEPSTL